MAEPHEEAARLFMRHKGYPGVEPYDVEKLDGQPCWYFLYELPEGILELEVAWEDGDWRTMVTAFNVANKV